MSQLDNNELYENKFIDIHDISSKELKSEMKFKNGYYRFQKDVQTNNYIKRNEEQKKLFDEYFVVPNYTTIKCNLTYKKLSKLFRVLAIVFAAIFVFNVFSVVFSGIIRIGSNFFTIFSFIIFVASLIANKIFVNKFYDTVIYEDAPEKLLSDEEYEQIVKEKIANLNVVTNGLNKFGLDSSQIEEIKPIVIEDRIILNKSLLVYNYESNKLNSSTQCVTVIYLMDTHLLAYKLQFDMCSNYVEEFTSEIFYNDICDINTFISHNSYETIKNDNKEHTTKKVIIEENSVTCNIITTNFKFSFVINGDDEEKLSSMYAMIQKIRDKKN